MAYQDLMAALPGKRLTRVLNCTKQSPLTFTEIVVYSCLVHRATHGKGADQQQIGKAVKLDQSTSVPGALTVLVTKQLVEKRGGRWFALQPQEEAAAWFRECRDTGNRPWYRRLSYWWMGLPAKESALTLKQMAVYFKLLNLRDNGRKQTRSGLAALLRLDRKTIRTAVAKLQAAGLVNADLLAVEPQPDQLEWFRNRPAKTQFKLSEKLSLSRSSHEVACNQLDGYGSMMVDAGYAEQQIVDFFKFALTKADRKASVFCGFVDEFEELFRGVEKDHASNQAAGKYAKAQNSLGLLKAEASKQIKRRLARIV